MENYLKIKDMDFTKEEYQRRLKKVQKMMQEKGIELLISHDTNNLNYLTVMMPGLFIMRNVQLFM